ncbi:TetR/AcrR family transcriptional regulator [Nocardia sp. alder85J]|uniref:TetR/AcrR family transcriptional regulator n=1 Tax=Nocardia sp. alder85J TaxID=2862949 RepID=UPI001CD77D13|nr:TetR/AcrR family transcriptional regulator [Nocardia sp. alder85J]MCX4097963.1 TetR/AcrR family transcriptional regulator [Nocardia sp. alder85J]
MTTPRRMGTEQSKTRHQLLDIVERLMLEEGYAAVGIRRVAREAGVTPPLVHYYFQTLDDLFIAALERRAEQLLTRQAQILESTEHPLQVMWELAGQPAGITLTNEFAALSAHRKNIRSHLAEYARRYRALQVTVLTRYLERTGRSMDGISPEAAIFLMTAICQVRIREESMGMTIGHAEALLLVDEFIRRLQGEVPPAAPAPAVTVDG